MVQLDQMWYWPLIFGFAPFWEIGIRTTYYLYQKRHRTEVVLYSNSTAEFRAREIWLAAAYAILSIVDIAMLAQLTPNTTEVFLGTYEASPEFRTRLSACLWFPFAVSFYVWFTYDEYRRKSPFVYTFHHSMALLLGAFCLYAPAESLIFMIPVDIGDVILHCRSYLKLTNSPVVHQLWMKIALFVSLVGKNFICLPLFIQVAQRKPEIGYVVWLLSYSIYALFAVLWVSKWVCVRKETRLEQQYQKEKYQEQQDAEGGDPEHVGSKGDLEQAGSKGDLMAQAGSRGENEKPEEGAEKHHENGEKQQHENGKTEGIELTVLSG